MIDAVWEACNRVDEGMLSATWLDSVLRERQQHHEDARERAHQEFEERERLEFMRRTGACMPLGPCDPTIKLVYTMKEVKAMRLADALRAIRTVPLAEIETELKEAKANLDAVKKDAKVEYQRKVKAALDEVKMLNRLKMSKEKAGKPLRRKGKAA